MSLSSKEIVTVTSWEDDRLYMASEQVHTPSMCFVSSAIYLAPLDFDPVSMSHFKQTNSIVYEFAFRLFRKRRQNVSNLLVRP